jgi:predicted deacylase
MADEFKLGGRTIAPGEEVVVDLPVASLLTHAPVNLTARVRRGRRPGPCLLVTGCLHGDEICGAEIVRRVMMAPSLKRMRGTLVAVPVMNMPSFLARSRYLPDRRDLNRLFPGAAAGSLGARLAKVVTSELLPMADAVIDLHSGAVNRGNLPQVRVTTKDRESMQLARAFNPPAILVSSTREGSFREACRAAGKPVVLFESGEALRLDAATIRFGLQGILSVMRHLGMLPKRGKSEPRKTPTVVCQRSTWERAPRGGLFTPLVTLGKAVAEGEMIGFVADPIEGDEHFLKSSLAGIVIGRSNEGLVTEGDALFHIAVTADPGEAEEGIVESGEALPSIPDEGDDHPVHGDVFSDNP